MQEVLNLIDQSPVFLYYAVLNIGLAGLYFIDKMKAINHSWRIPEKSLLTGAVLGGAFGGLAGMLIFRHKTRHGKFWAINCIFAAVHLAILLQLIKRGIVPPITF